MLKLLLAPLLFATVGFAQQYQVEFGGMGRAQTTPRLGGYAAATISSSASLTRSFNLVEMHPISKTQIAFITRTGVERTLYADDQWELTTLGQIGIATNSTATTGAVSGGLGIRRKLKGNSYLSIRVEALATPIAGWEPALYIGLGRKFGQ